MTDFSSGDQKTKGPETKKRERLRITETKRRKGPETKKEGEVEDKSRYPKGRAADRTVYGDGRTFDGRILAYPYRMPSRRHKFQGLEGTMHNWEEQLSAFKISASEVNVIHPIHVDFHPGEIGKTIIFPKTNPEKQNKGYAQDKIAQIHEKNVIIFEPRMNQKTLLAEVSGKARDRINLLHYG
ncbi:hypothetical protein B0H10DRAFT_2379545 [Mycena sp. CBHHK59/15]|nr:hypothetical protein B0H10DRAFT_2379545 [Mycena sp. CBHHK59/15]